MNPMNPSVDGYLRKSPQWRAELQRLRQIVLDSPLREEVKWRVPCYTFEGKNILFLGRFKAFCALSFIKGALLKDPQGILDKPGPNTQSARLIRFTDLQQVVEREPLLKEYIQQAIEVEKAGLKAHFKKGADFPLPEEFQSQLDQSAPLKRAFEALTPGRQRAYLLHFSAAKQSKTRTARIQRCARRILDGKGLNDE